MDPYEKVYLGDAVYANFDGFYIMLETSNGITVTNRIALEPEVMKAFRLYVDQLNKLIEAKGGRPI